MKRPDLAERNRSVRNGHLPYEDAEWMRDAYLVRQLSIREIAKEAACGSRTIARWIDIHEIPTRSSDEGKRLNQRSGSDHPNWRGASVCSSCGGPKSYGGKNTCKLCVDKVGTANSNWRGDDIGIGGAHDRVKSVRGLANTHSCLFCGGEAKHWAYDHTDPHEKMSPEDGPYSTDPAHYMPLCVSCHKRFDLEFLATA